MVVKFEQRGWTPRERAFKLSIQKNRGSTKKKEFKKRFNHCFKTETAKRKE